MDVRGSRAGDRRSSDRAREGRQARARRVRDRRQGLPRLQVDARLPDHAQGARRRLPDGPPAPVAAVASGSTRSSCGARTRSSRRSATTSTSTASPSSTRRSSRPPRARARPRCSTAVLRRGHGVPHPERPALHGGRRGRVGKVVLLRPHLPRREVQDAPAPDRVLDGRARGGVHGPRGAIMVAEGMICLAWSSACSRRRQGGARRCSSATRRKLEQREGPFPRIHYADAIKLIQAKGIADAVGRRLRRRRRDGDRQAVRPPGHRAPLPDRAQGVLLQARSERTRSRGSRPDVLAPEGYGEIVGGGQREDEPGQAGAADPRPQAARGGVPAGTSTSASTAPSRTPASAGGRATFVAWICGLQHVRETIPFPRMLYRIYP